MCGFVCFYASEWASQRIAMRVCIYVCVCVFVCVLPRHVTLAGYTGVTCPLGSSTGVHIEDGMRHKVCVCVKGADSQSSPCALQLLWTHSSPGDIIEEPQ